ncbi:11661_t:CDS:2, partial [Gigaspora margarita]
NTFFCDLNKVLLNYVESKAIEKQYNMINVSLTTNYCSSIEKIKNIPKVEPSKSKNFEDEPDKNSSDKENALKDNSDKENVLEDVSNNENILEDRSDKENIFLSIQLRNSLKVDFK